MIAQVLKDSTKKLSSIFNDESLTPEDRGVLGEEVIFELTRLWASQFKNHIILHSYIYKQSPNLSTASMNTEPVTETDILLITPYRIFVIEVKTIYGEMKVYKDSNIEVVTKGKFKKKYIEKNYLRQNESHCRHLYYHLYKFLHEGNPSFIVPITVMVGNMSFEDERSSVDKKKNVLIGVNDIITTLNYFNKPLGYLLPLKSISKKLQEVNSGDKEKLIASQQFK